MALAPHASTIDMGLSVAELIRPARRIKPSDAVGEYLRTEKGPWDRDHALMMLEPLDILSSRRYQGIVYVGPSRTSKTMTLVLGAVTYIVTSSPADTMIVQMTEGTARAMSRKDLDRAIRHSPELQSRLSPRPRDNNVFDKYFKSGMALNMGWPSVTQLSSQTYKYMLLTDYDRPENRDDVDGEGMLWDVAFPRVRTYMSRGKCLAESSPGGEYLDAQWRPTTPHEGPPATGIISIYNRGTRARWYWPCLHCGEYFEAKPGLDNFNLPPFEQLEKDVLKHEPMWLAEQFARLPCPACGAVHLQIDKLAMNRRGHWIHEGESIGPDGVIEGERRETDIASYWQGGVSATYQPWKNLLLRFFQGLQTYVGNGDEKSLKATTNTDQAAPYLPRSVQKRRNSSQLMDRAEDWKKGYVPTGTKFLTAAVDVQKHRFVVHVIGWGVGLESWLIDRFTITSSRRAEGDRTAALQPASYLEDWLVLKDEVIAKRYPLVDEPHVLLPIRLTLCDSGGVDGVTSKAYDFWRSLRGSGLDRRFMLIKGDHRMGIPRAAQTWPDSKKRSDRRSGGRGDVPVWLLNVNLLKDSVAGDLGREETGPGYHHIPQWIDAAYYDEVTAETKTLKGWSRTQHSANEAFDLHVYNRAACIILKAEHPKFWISPPSWARPELLVTQEAASATDAREAAPVGPPQPDTQQKRKQPMRRRARGFMGNW